MSRERERQSNVRCACNKINKHTVIQWCIWKKGAIACKKKKILMFIVCGIVVVVTVWDYDLS